ncbi:NAD(P)-binding protein [Auricularia subglabra TFB-10046 SS5]|nr:NAD(P)-binding protein [Auricularia subglabra TFB-10046 SS5]
MAPTVLITGASRGIGLAATQFLLADGAQVVTVQRTTSPGLKTLAETYPTRLRNVQGDCTAEEIIKGSIREAMDTFGTIDAVVFNAAAAYGIGHVEQLSLEDWQKTFDVNVFGVVKFLKEVLPVLKDGSRIISTSSAAAELGIIGASPYNASKAALNSINRTVAAEHPSKICVALHPGAMQQAFVVNSKGILPDSLVDMFPELLEPEVPGRVIADLALRASPALSGKYMHWDDPLLASLCI